MLIWLFVREFISMLIQLICVSKRVPGQFSYPRSNGQHPYVMSDLDPDYNNMLFLYWFKKVGVFVLPTFHYIYISETFNWQCFTDTPSAHMFSKQKTSHPVTIFAGCKFSRFGRTVDCGSRDWRPRGFESHRQQHATALAAVMPHHAFDY